MTQREGQLFSAEEHFTGREFAVDRRAEQRDGAIKIPSSCFFLGKFDVDDRSFKGGIPRHAKKLEAVCAQWTVALGQDNAS